MEDDCKLYTVPPERIIARLMKEQTEFKETIRELQKRVFVLEVEKACLIEQLESVQPRQDAPEPPNEGHDRPIAWHVAWDACCHE